MPRVLGSLRGAPLVAAPRASTPHALAEAWAAGQVELFTTALPSSVGGTGHLYDHVRHELGTSTVAGGALLYPGDAHVWPFGTYVGRGDLFVGRRVLDKTNPFTVLWAGITGDLNSYYMFGNGDNPSGCGFAIARAAFYNWGTSSYAMTFAVPIPDHTPVLFAASCKNNQMTYWYRNLLTGYEEAITVAVSQANTAPSNGNYTPGGGAGSLQYHGIALAAQLSTALTLDQIRRWAAEPFAAVQHFRPRYHPTGGAQTGTPAAAVATWSVVTPGVTLGTVAATPAVAIASWAAVTPGVSLGLLAATPAAAVASWAPTTPGVTLGSVTASPAPATAAWSDVTPALTLGSVASSPAPATSAWSVSPLTSSGAVTGTPPAAVMSWAVVAPAPTLGPVTGTPPAAVAAWANTVPGLTLGPLVTNPSPAVSAWSVVTPVASGGGTSIPAAAVSAWSVVTPGVALGLVAAAPSAAVAAWAAVQPTIALGAISVSPSPAIVAWAVNQPVAGYYATAVAPALGWVKFPPARAGVLFPSAQARVQFPSARTRLTFSNGVSMPGSALSLPKGDTAILANGVTLVGPDGVTAQSLVGVSSVTFTQTALDGTVVVAGVAVSILDAPNGKVECPADVSTVGTYRLYYVVTFSNGKSMTFPSTGPATLIVVAP